MLDVANSIIALIITLGILVTVHEYGHFWVARRCGVKVLRFSVGFGRPLLSWHDKQGTEFVIALIPLGGYVKMLDEREAPVPDEQLHQAFNRKPVSNRIAIVAAGPITNFIFAILAYWLMFVVGVNTLAPVVGQVIPESPAAVGGLEPQREIVAIDGQTVEGWRDVSLKLVDYLGDTGVIKLSTRSVDGFDQADYQIPVEQWLKGEKDPDLLAELGITPFRPHLPPVLDTVIAGGRAEAAGLTSGDEILAVNGESIKDWPMLVERIQAAPEQPLAVEVLRDGERLNLTLTPEARDNDDGKLAGFMGASVQPVPWPENMIREQRYGPLAALGQAVTETGEMTWSVLKQMQKMLAGLISIENLSGPITIARIAGQSISSGWENFIGLLAFISIMLGVLNLLPIPVLDGGHLLYYGIELVRGKPLSEKAQMLGLSIGFSLIMMLMVVALYNDITRL